MRRGPVVPVVRLTGVIAAGGLMGGRGLSIETTASLLRRAGTDTQKAEWIDDLAEGRRGFAFGDKAVLLRVRTDPVRFRVTGGRTWHDGLLMDMGQLVLRSAGSVGHEGSLSMMVEVGLRGDAVLAESVPDQDRGLVDGRCGHLGRLFGGCRSGRHPSTRTCS